MPERILCDLCDQPIPTSNHYIVRIEIFADPSMPPITSEELAEMDLDAKMRELLEEMKHLSAEELQDQVHRRFDYRVCRPCQIRFLANPLGKPRQARTGKN